MNTTLSLGIMLELNGHDITLFEKSQITPTGKKHIFENHQSIGPFHLGDTVDSLIKNLNDLVKQFDKSLSVSKDDFPSDELYEAIAGADISIDKLRLVCFSNNNAIKKESSIEYDVDISVRWQEAKEAMGVSFKKLTINVTNRPELIAAA